VGAAANVIVMALTVSAFKSSDSPARHAIYFTLACIVLLVTRFLSQLYLIRLSNDTVYQLQVRISEQIAGMPLKQLEDLGSASLLSVVSDDVNTISGLGLLLPALVMNFCIILGILGYLLYLSPAAFLVLCATIIASLIGHQILTAGTSPLMQAFRREQESVLESVQTLIFAGKELRLNQLKSLRTVETVKDHAEAARTLGNRAWKRYSMASGWAYSAYFSAIAVLVVSAKAHLWGLRQDNALAAVFGVLFLKGSVETVLSSLPAVGKAKAAFARTDEMGIKLMAKQEERSGATAVALGDEPLRHLEFSEISYRYDDVTGQAPFRLGPINVQVRAGELMFITGANGAGKTSFLKLICGLYVPTSGSIQLNGKTIRPEHLHLYRQQFGSVFQEFHVLKAAMLQSHLDNSHAQQYLEEFRLHTRVTVDGEGFHCAPLSRGQQKRLALIIALLEERPIYILDEWAADQDPHFRAYFYETLLPRLRSAGKTVIAVTHDEMWHSIADRVFRLDAGRLFDKSKDLISSATDSPRMDRESLAPDTTIDRGSAGPIPARNTSVRQ
jgi:putative ATP-binding cassette transporter